MLLSRDEQSCLVVSYKDIKTYVETAFECVKLPRVLCAFFSFCRRAGNYQTRAQQRYDAVCQVWCDMLEGGDLRKLSIALTKRRRKLRKKIGSTVFCHLDDLTLC